MSYFDKIKNKRPDRFLRQVGISLVNFENLLQAVEKEIGAAMQKNPLKRRGKKSEVTLADRLLLTLLYLRQYSTFERLAEQFDICESYACKIYHQMCDILVKILKLKNRKALLEEPVKVILIDVTEQPIERPTRGQKEYYSGKKKRHTIKTQLLVCFTTMTILALCCKKGRVHDFRILKESRPLLHPDTIKIGDSGYQGIDKLFSNAVIPIKKQKGKSLTKEEKKYNRALAKQRILIEHVNRRCKIFRIVKETYRGKHRNYGKTWTIIAGLVNLRYAA
jgi:hypothetical protein